jgi:hypothetical protein
MDRVKTSLLTKRFGELYDQIKIIESTKRYAGDATYMKGDYVDNELYIGWKIKARNLISRSCGENSEHYKAFDSVEHSSAYCTNYEILIRLKAVFEAAREDFEGGHCKTTRDLIQAEVFGSELDQASELLNAGYFSAAAVIAGVVLETTLRGLCDNLALPQGKLDKMNADLAKAGHYNLLVQKRITALADIRNNAAHGHPDKFSKTDVQDMIAYIQGFVGDHL